MPPNNGMQASAGGFDGAGASRRALGCAVTRKEVMYLRLLAVSVVVSASSFAIALAQPDEVSAEIISPTVRVVASGGVWQADGRYGTCRIVVKAVGWEHVRHVIYAQWIVHDDETKTSSIINSLRVDELDARAWVNVQAVSYKASEKLNVFTVRFRTRDQPELEETIVLVLGKPGTYTVNED